MSDEIAGRRRLARLCGRLLSAALFLYLLHFREGIFFWRISQQEGTWIDEAFFTLQGELIYRDFFEQMTPGIVYVNVFFCGCWVRPPPA